MFCDKTPQPRPRLSCHIQNWFLAAIIFITVLLQVTQYQTGTIRSRIIFLCYYIHFIFPTVIYMYWIYSLDNAFNSEYIFIIFGQHYFTVTTGNVPKHVKWYYRYLLIINKKLQDHPIKTLTYLLSNQIKMPDKIHLNVWKS